ncbi:UDP-glycosyltransferase 75D1 [Hibiscus syriacus]|uniref:Glycosyltransferase n=1 Tax=Hibiscus syriacus TaxID=106335 RepID=A0A6A3C3R3_HIBSY|nr:phloretin 4'-O-glucosyltransferase-like [Hibiscus syriacus]KAE8723825.1 UDP-glycosyltransferase 75D1 [Hibiscus syriacus]
MAQPQFVLVTIPIQGHINPALQFAKRLIRTGVRVTFVTTISAIRRMTKVPAAQGLSFSPFSDGYDYGVKPGDDPVIYLTEFRRRSKEALSDLIITNENEAKPVTCIIYTLLQPWAAEVAREYHIPSALLWIQPATVFDLYYFYFNGYESAIKDQADESNPECQIKLPGLPPLAARDLPSFFASSNVYQWGLSTFQEQMEVLAEEPNAKILINTFDSLEPEAFKAIDKFKMTAVGPLIPSSFLKDQLDSSLRIDLFQCDSNEYLRWLDSKPKSSVVYVSFGSMSVLAKEQMEEIARALTASGRPFLWVVRNRKDRGEEEMEEDKLSFREELEKLGMIVPWCSQVKVLSHPSLGCFVSHCGWNSTLESLVAGVPVVAFPQWNDQGTNAKLIEDVWKCGVRVSANEEGIVERGEIVRCLDLTMGDGEKGKEVRRNVVKWRDLAREAAVDGGSLDMNLKAFVDEVAQGCK